MTLRGSCWFCVLAIGAALPVRAQAQATADPTTNLLTETGVLVTARKIEEDLQDIPMSVQVVSGEYLDEMGTTRMYELQFAVPGLLVNSTGFFGGGFSLRGIADQRVAGTSVAPHLNGVYVGDTNLIFARLFDIDRIEVLKGPQGTLYGRNSTGGSINIFTRAPQNTASSEIEIAHGSFETTRAEGHLNLPVSEAALRLAFVASDGDGYIRNSVDDRRFAENDYWGVRASFRVDAGDALRLDIVAQHARDDGASGDLWSPRLDFLVNPNDIRLTTVTLEDPYLISETDNLNVNLDYDLGFATLRSITGYARSEVRGVDDCAGIPSLLGCVRSVLPNDFDQWSQELQLVFPRSRAIEGIVGAYYSDADAVTALYALQPLANTQPLSDNLSTFSDPTSALFGQATMHFADKWSATAGLRLSREEHRTTTIGTGINDSPTLLVASNELDNLSWLLDLSYAASDDVMYYAGVSTGYKSGGFITTRLVNGEPDTFGTEYVTAFEAGAKSQWFSGRLTLNSAAFFYDYEDLQVSTTVFVNGLPVFGTDNAAKAEIYGVDADMNFVLSERWSAFAGVTWLPKREFVEYRTATTDTLSGNELVRAPEWSASGTVEYQRPLSSLGSLSLRLEYSFRSDYFYTAENDPRAAQDAFGLLNAHLMFEAASETWYVFASGRNLTDEDYFNQVIVQSSPGYPDTYEIGVGFRF